MIEETVTHSGVAPWDEHFEIEVVNGRATLRIRSGSSSTEISIACQEVAEKLEEALGRVKGKLRPNRWGRVETPVVAGVQQPGPQRGSGSTQQRTPVFIGK